MKYLGNNIFKLSAWEKAKKLIVSSYYPLCIIPYIYLLTHQPFYCIASSFLICLIGGVIYLFAVWQNENTSKMNWVIWSAFAPGLFMLILSPALIMQKILEILQD
jgi:hypothetical protein